MTGITVWDTDIPGFGLKVNPNGRKTYIFKYRVGGGRRGQQRKPTIGNHGPLTATQAREIARAWHASVRSGGDPSGDRLSLRNAPTVSELCDRYLSEHARIRKKPKSIGGDESAIARVVKPVLGPMKVNAVTRADVERLHKSLRKTPPTANRVVALVSKMMSLAERWNLRPQQSNPCRGIERFRETPRQRFLNLEEIDRLDRTLSTHEAINPWMTALVRLLYLTGARRGELEALRWSEVEFAEARLRIPDSKTGPKVIVLSARAVSIFAGLRRVDNNPFVFIGKKHGTHVNGIAKFWQRVRRQADLDGVRLHDLRHSFASIAAANGASLPMIGKLLGHKSTATTARYAHLLDEQLREIANSVARMVTRQN
ncbi:MAG: tyrosine-type recombinase/integrase [Micropepsaceae bacterium]